MLLSFHVLWFPATLQDLKAFGKCHVYLSVHVCVDSKPRLFEASCLVGHRGIRVVGEAEGNICLAVTQGFPVKVHPVKYRAQNSCPCWSQWEFCHWPGWIQAFVLPLYSSWSSPFVHQSFGNELCYKLLFEREEWAWPQSLPLWHGPVEAGHGQELLFVGHTDSDSPQCSASHHRDFQPSARNGNLWNSFCCLFWPADLYINWGTAQQHDTLLYKPVKKKKVNRSVRAVATCCLQVQRMWQVMEWDLKQPTGSHWARSKLWELSRSFCSLT